MLQALMLILSSRMLTSDTCAIGIADGRTERGAASNGPICDTQVRCVIWPKARSFVTNMAPTPASAQEISGLSLGDIDCREREVSVFRGDVGTLGPLLESRSGDVIDHHQKCLFCSHRHTPR